MKLVSFEIFDGENSYDQYSIFKTDISKLEWEDLIEEVYGDVRKGDHRRYKVRGCVDITENEASVLRKFLIAFID